MPTFSYTPDFQAKKQSQPKVTRIQFGDGYMQRQAVGLNSDLKTWEVVFANRSNTEADAIEAFFEARAAVEAFDWTPPQGGDAGLFICSKWERSVDRANLNTVTATFEEVAEA